MFNSAWWQEKRYQHERRTVAVVAAVGVVVLVFVAILGYATHLGVNHQEPIALSPHLTPAESPSLPPTTTAGLLEQAAGKIAAGNTAEGAVALRQAGLLVIRLEGILAWKQGDLPLAAQSFSRALEIDPESVPDLVNLAGVELSQGRATQAVEHLSRARGLAMDDPYIANRLLLARLQAGDIAGVRSEVQAVLESNPENGLPTVAIAAAALELAAGQPRNAANFLYAASSVLPQTIFTSLLEEPPLASHSHREELSPFYPASNVPGAP